MAVTPGDTAAHLMFRSNPTDVRCALQEVMSVLEKVCLDDAHRNSVELVLAEVLNNIVEHAYGPSQEGEIQLAIEYDSPRVRCTVIDDGLPMPQGRVPQGNAPAVPTETDAVPEGGFGWYLIRSMTENLQYWRLGGRNCLEFSIPAGRG